MTESWEQRERLARLEAWRAWALGRRRAGATPDDLFRETGEMLAEGGPSSAELAERMLARMPVGAYAPPKDAA